MNVDLTNDGEKLAFLSGLKQYLDDKGKVLLPYPRLAGRAIDLHDLYNRVTALGGYQKVTEKELWEDLLKQYNFEKVSSTLCYGLKIIYQRFLEEYERVHYFGDDEGSKKPRFDISIRASRRPTTYMTEYERHKRNFRSVSSNASSRFNPNNYERIAFSLISCLPNEVDFAINACTLLSGESRHVLRLARCPQVLEALLLHAGIVSDNFDSFSEIAETWIAKTKHDLEEFWKNTVEDSVVLNEMLFTNGNMCNCKDSTATEQKNSSVSSTFNNRQYSFCAITRSDLKEKLSKWSDGLFLSARAPGVQDYEGQRVLQIALVLLNLSFEEFNIYLLACSKPLIRFTFLCIHSSYSALRQTGLDILGNISSKMDLLTLGLNILRCTFQTLEQCILSSDKFDKVRGLEILGNLCRSPTNKDCLITSISDSIYLSAIQLLALGDIELMLAALDALYYLSKLGEESCTRIMVVSGCINTLVSLITINVRGVGSEHLAKIRIVKRILPTANISNEPHIPTNQHHIRAPGIAPALMNQHLAPNPHPTSFPNPIHPHPQHKQIRPSHMPFQHPRTPINPLPSTPVFRHPPVVTASQQAAQPPVRHHRPPLPTPMIVSQTPFPSRPHVVATPPTSVLAPPPNKATPSSKPPLSAPKQLQETKKKEIPATVSSVHKPVTVPMYTHTESQLIPPVFHYIPAPPASIVLDKSPESFAKLWVWATYESCSNEACSTPRVEVFAEYAAAATRYGMHGTRQVLPAAEFGRCLQQVFPNAASRLFKDEQGQPMYHITGIKKRQTPLPVPGHHLQSPGVENKQAASIPPTSNNLNSVAASLAPQKPPSKDVGPSTSSSHHGATSTPPPDQSNLITNDQCPAVATSSCAPTPRLVNSTPTEANPNHEVAASGGVKDNGDFSENSTDLCNSLSTNNLADRRRGVDSVTHNHCTNHNPQVVGASARESDDKPTVPSECSPAPDKSLNHCDSTGSGRMGNGEIDDDIKASESMATDGIDPATSKMKSEKSPTKQLDVTKHNGEVPDVAVEPSHNSLTKKEEIKRELQTSKVVVNGVLEEHCPIENGLNCDVKSVLDDKSLTKNQQHSPCDDVSATPDDKGITQSTKISPQVSPIAPRRLQKHYESQKKAEVTSPIPTPTPTPTPIPNNNNTPIFSGLKSNELKRPHPDTNPASCAPPMKLQKSSMERFPILSPNRLPFPVPPLKQPPAIVPNQPPAPQSLAPQPLINSPAAHHRGVIFPRHRAPPPLPPSHANQAKPPVIDLMAPNASHLVLLRNCGRFHFEDVTDEKEDPISKSVRLTAVLILINICHYSDRGRSLLQRHESWFAQLSMSRIDCSSMIAKLLAEIDR